MHIPFVSKTKNRCSHQTKDGAPCNATPQAGKPYCFFHDPERAEDRTAARRQGGLTSIGKFAPVVPPNLPRLSLKTPEDVGRLYEDTINHVLQGQMDLRTANVIRSLANGLLRTLAAAHRHQREEAKATLPGKGVSPSFETGNSKLETAPTGAPHSRPSASGNNTKQNGTDDIRHHQQKPEATCQRELHPLPDKAASQVLPIASRTTDSTSTHQLETGNLKLETAPAGVTRSRPSASGNNTKQNGTDDIRQHQQKPGAACQRDLPTLPDKGVPPDRPSTENDDNQTPDWLLKLQDESMARIAQERGHREPKPGVLKPAVPHSRPSASGNGGPQSLPDKGVLVAHSNASSSTDSPSHHQLETGNSKLETVPVGNSKLETVLPTPVRDPDNEPSPIPGLLNRHLNYLKFAGMPVPESQRKRFHIPQAYVSSMSARKVEFEINSALRRKNRPE